MELDHILYGGDYNPEQWLDSPEILLKDIEYMKKAGINTVTVGVFSWAFLEPEEGVYSFDWLEEIMDRLYENGISIILGTPSGARPKWMSDRYPEVLRVSESRVRYLFGGRHNHCYTSPVYRQKIKDINTALVKRFASHKGVILWHISNEFGGECHCPFCQNAFREWLEKKYTTIEAVNQAWCTAFWSHSYQSFNQIESPSSIGEGQVHGLTLDWKRFVTHQTTDFATWEIKALREAGATQPTTVNLMYDYKGLNYDKLVKDVDIVSWDSYPVWHRQEDIVTARDNGMQHDYMRSLKHKPFLLMESSPSSTNWQGISKLKRPGLLSAASLQAVAHGSESILYFQIRQNRGGSEKFHGAVIDHYGGEDTRVFQEVKELGKDLSGLAEIVGSQMKSPVALIYDIENRWALEDSQGPRNDGLFYHEAVMKSYQALRRLGLNVDVISQERDISGYQLVVAPMLYLFRENIEEKIRDYVGNGGNFVLTYWSGIVDAGDRCFVGGNPHQLQDVFGLRRTETDSLYDGEVNQMVPGVDSIFTREYECRNLCDLIQTDGADAYLYYGSEFYKGMPVVTKNQYQKGSAYYVGADAEQALYDDLYKQIIAEHGILLPVTGEIPDGIEVTIRSSEEADYYFIQNYRNEIVNICCMQLEGDVLYGNSMEEMSAYETLILKKIK